MDFVDLYGGEPSRYTNIILPLTMKYRTAQDEWGFTGGFTRDNTLIGELLATGLVIRFTQRNLWTVDPTWTHMITEKFGFQTTFQFNDATYQEGIRLGLLDYQVYGGSAGLHYKVTEQDEVQLSATYNNFRTATAPIGLQAYYPGAMLPVTHALLFLKLVLWPLIQHTLSKHRLNGIMGNRYLRELHYYLEDLFMFCF